MRCLHAGSDRLISNPDVQIEDQWREEHCCYCVINGEAHGYERIDADIRNGQLIDTINQSVEFEQHAHWTGESRREVESIKYC